MASLLCVKTVHLGKRKYYYRTFNIINVAHYAVHHLFTIQTVLKKISISNRITNLRKGDRKQCKMSSDDRDEAVLSEFQQNHSRLFPAYETRSDINF